MARSSHILVLAYCVFLCLLDALPFPDLPNHIVRSCVVGGLLFDSASPYQEFGRLTPQFTPYILGDILAGSTCRVFGLTVTGIVWNIICFLSIPIGMQLIARKLSDQQRDSLLLFSILLSTGFFFLMGFVFFQIAIGISLATVSAFDLWTENKTSKSFILFVTLATLTFLTHLAPFVVLAPILTVKSLIKRSDGKLRIIEAFIAAVPLLGLFIVQIYHSISRPPADPTPVQYRFLSDKLFVFFEPLFHFQPYLDLLLLTAVATAFLVSYCQQREFTFQRFFQTSLQRELFFSAILLILLYIILPNGGWRLYYIDSRLLPFILLFGFSWLLLAVTNVKLLQKTLTFAALLNLIALSLVLYPANKDARELKRLVLDLPPHLSLIPIITQPNDILKQPLRHTACYYSAYNSGRSAYLLRGDYGDPMTFFEYRNRLPPTDGNWYSAGKAPPDWSVIRENYELLLVTKPYNSDKINFTGYRLFSENRVAAAFIKSE